MGFFDYLLLVFPHNSEVLGLVLVSKRPSRLALEHFILLLYTIHTPNQVIIIIDFTFMDDKCQGRKILDEFKIL